MKLGDSKVHADLRKLKSFSTLRKTGVLGLGRNKKGGKKEERGKREGAGNRERRRDREEKGEGRGGKEQNEKKRERKKEGQREGKGGKRREERERERRGERKRKKSRRDRKRGREGQRGGGREEEKRLNLSLLFVLRYVYVSRSPGISIQDTELIPTNATRGRPWQ